MSSLRLIARRAQRGARYCLVLAVALVDPLQRRFAREALALARELPARMDSPLPAALGELTPAAASQALETDTIRQIVDALAAFGAGRPLGICLRKSLLRYYFLRRAGLPVTIHFGARRLGERLGGHAWLTLDGQPYYETPEHYLNYVLMFSYPQPL